MDTKTDTSTTPNSAVPGNKTQPVGAGTSSKTSNVSVENAASEAAQSPSEQSVQPVIVANNLALHTRRGPVYGPVTVKIGTGITVLHGPVGSGRTTLLLTMAGRMKPDSQGMVETLGIQLPNHAHKVQKLTAIAGFPGIDDIDESLTLAAIIRERKAWLAPWYKFTTIPSQKSVDAALAPVFGARHFPRRTRFYSLNDSQKLLVKVALALLAKPRVLFMDSMEQIQSAASRQDVWHVLSLLAADGLDIVVSAAGDDRNLWDALPVKPQLVDVGEIARLTAAAQDGASPTPEAASTPAQSPAQSPA